MKTIQERFEEIFRSRGKEEERLIAKFVSSGYGPHIIMVVGLAQFRLHGNQDRLVLAEKMVRMFDRDRAVRAVNDLLRRDSSEEAWWFRHLLEEYLFTSNKLRRYNMIELETIHSGKVQINPDLVSSIQEQGNGFVFYMAGGQTWKFTPDSYERYVKFAATVE